VRWIVPAFAAAALSACVQQGLEEELELPELDVSYFRCDVEPVLIKRCSFEACHGTDERPFRVYAPHRLRLDGLAGSPLTEAEHRANYDKALGFAGADGAPPLLMLKGLAVEAGGYFHRGAELYGGGDAFLAAEDPGYQTIATWIVGRGQAPTDCTPAPEVGP